jgi:preprotein translocase subunit SecD
MVVQAIGAARSESDPRARFFVLRNVVRLTNAAITAPRLSSDTSGAPDVRFGFTRAGGARFQRLTAAIARRGDLVSGLGQTLDQHFAFVLDGRLLAVDSIDYKSYPDGISGSSGAEITGSFTAQSARTFAALLRWGPLPVTLMLR